MKYNRHINFFAFAIAILIHMLLFLFREPMLKNQAVSAKDTINLCFQPASIENENIEKQKTQLPSEKPVKPKPLPKKKPLERKKPVTSPKKQLSEPQVPPQSSVAKNQGVSESVSSGTEALKMNTYLSLIRSKIERNKYYPRYSKKMNHQGTSTVKMIIASDGSVLNITIVSSSGYNTLDKAALDAVKNTVPLPPPSDYGLGKVSLNIPLCYLLN